MGEVKKTHKVKLIIGIIYNQEFFLDKVKEILRKKYGENDLESKIIDFNYTEYYRKEMGINLKKKFISFKNLIKADKIVKIKLFTNRLEKKFQDIKGNRCVNIDPGYLEYSKFILVTTKNYSHRIYLKRGIFAELALIYRNNKFEDLAWTYPDYKTKKYKDFFNIARNTYKQQILNI